MGSTSWVNSMSWVTQSWQTSRYPSSKREPRIFFSFQLGSGKCSAPARILEAQVAHFPIPQRNDKLGNGNCLIPARTTKFEFSLTDRKSTRLNSSHVAI